MRPPSPLLLVVVLALPPCGWAGEESAPRTDHCGDPLPAGAVARLGTSRLRHQHSIGALALSANGKLVASCNGAYGTLRVWETATGKLVRQLLEADLGGHLALTPDGKTLAASLYLPHRKIGNDCEVRLWDVATGRETCRIPQQRTGALAFSDDGKTLAIGEHHFPLDEYSILLWDVAAGRQRRRLSCPYPVCGLAFSADGKTLASGHAVEKKRELPQGAVCLWDVATGRRLHRLQGPCSPVAALAVSGDGKRIIAGVEPLSSGPCYVWEVAGGKLIGEVRDDRAPHVLCLTRLADGRVLCLKHRYGPETLVREAETGKLVRALPPGYDVATLSADGGTVALGNVSGVVDLWDLRTGKQLAPHAGHHHQMTSIHYSPDSRMIATSGECVCFWEAATGRAIRSLDVSVPYVILSEQLAFSPDFKVLAMIDAEKRISLWETGSGKEIRRLDSSRKYPRCLAFSPDGKSIATDGSEGEIILWDTADGRPKRTLGGEKRTSRGPADRIAFTPDGKMILVADISTVFFWDATTGKRCSQFPEEGIHQDGFAVSPGGDLLATADRQDEVPPNWPIRPPNRPIRLWELSTGKLHCLLEDDAHNRKLLFSPDGRTLAVSGYPNRAQLYELASGKVRLRLPGRAPFAFAPDGKTLAISDGSTSPLVWDLTGLLHEEGEVKELRLSAVQLQGLWADLASEDAAKAYRAVRRLAAAPTAAVELRGVLRPVPVTDAAIARLVRDLDDERFAVREEASRQLESRLGLAEAILRQALEDSPSLEQRGRINRLLEQLRWPIRSPQALRVLRAVEALEDMGTPEGKEILARLARGAPQALVTQEAKAALRRLSGKGLSAP